MKFKSLLLLMVLLFSLPSFAQIPPGGCCPSWGRQKVRANNYQFNDTRTNVKELFRKYKSNLITCEKGLDFLKSFKHLDQLFLDYQNRLTKAATASIDPSKVVAPKQDKDCGDDEKKEEVVTAKELSSSVTLTLCLFKGTEITIQNILQDPNLEQFLKLDEGLNKEEAEAIITFLGAIEKVLEHQDKKAE